MSNSLPLPSSPDSSSPPSVYRPFSHLPTELVQFIIESTVPRHYHSTTYIQRQKILRSLSLVSRLFRQIADPLLFTIVSLSSQSVMNSWWAQDPARTESRRPIELVASKLNIASGFNSSTIQHPALKFLALSQLTHLVDFYMLAPLANLQILRLSDLSVNNVRNVQLASVVELQFLRVCTGEYLDRILGSKTFPALRAFSYSDGDYEANTPFESVLGVLSPQLDALSLDSDMISELRAETTCAIKNFTLFDLYDDPDNLPDDLPDVQNIRVVHVERQRGLAETLEFISDSLAHQSPTSLQLLYLPELKVIDWSEKTLEAELCRLTDICCGRGVEIMKEEQPGSWPSDGCISSDFWRRMKEAKAKEN